jgi:hypothetical protein
MTEPNLPPSPTPIDNPFHNAAVPLQAMSRRRSFSHGTRIMQPAARTSMPWRIQLNLLSYGRRSTSAKRAWRIFSSSVYSKRTAAAVLAAARQSRTRRGLGAQMARRGAQLSCRQPSALVSAKRTSSMRPMAPLCGLQLRRASRQLGPSPSPLIHAMPSPSTDQGLLAGDTLLYSVRGTIEARISGDSRAATTFSLGPTAPAPQGGPRKKRADNTSRQRRRGMHSRLRAKKIQRRLPLALLTASRVE